MQNYPGMNFEIIRFTTLDIMNASNPDLNGEEQSD